MRIVRPLVAIIATVVVIVPWVSGRSTAATATPACVAGAGYGGFPGGGTNDPLGGDGCVLVEYDAGSGTVFETFNFTGALQNWTVPAGVGSVRFHLIGAGGGAGKAGNTPASDGGGGGYATGTYAVAPGDVFDIIVGEGGDRQNASAVNRFSGETERRNCSYGGGACGQGQSGYSFSFGSGGGRSAVRTSGDTEDLVTAGGGGGGGYSAPGGAGGGASGVAGSGTGGGGGSQIAGGAAGGPSETGTAGTKYAGGYAGTVTSGNQGSEGGGGGGGYYGGGGAGDNGGGGGGSSYVALLTGGSTTAGSGRVPGLIAPVNTTAPVIAGGTSVNSVLTATGGTWNVANGAAWQWQSSSDGVTFTDIPGETGATITATQSLSYRVVEFRSNLLGSAQKESNVIVVIAAATTTTTTTASTTTTAAPTTTVLSTTTSVAPVVVEQTATTTTTTTASTTTTAASTSTTVPAPTTTLPDPNVPGSNEGRTRITQGGSTVYGMPEGGWVRSGAVDGAFVVTTSEGLAVRISAKAGTETTNQRGMPVFDANDTFQVDVKGLRPNTSTSTWLFSAPTLLGRSMTDASGNLSAEYPIGAKVPAGDHTAQLNAIAPDGTLRSVEVSVEIIDTVTAADSKSSTGGAAVPEETPGDTGAPTVPGTTVGIVAGALVLMSVGGSSGRGGSRSGGSRGGSRGGGRGGDPTDQGSIDRVDEGGEVAGVGGGHVERARDGREDRWAPPAHRRIDGSVRGAAAAVAPRVPVLASILEDGSYLRALFGWLWVAFPLAGAVIGVSAALGTDFTVMLPAWWIVVSMLVLGCLDAFAGFAFVTAFGLTLLVGGGIDSVVSARGFLGLSVFFFALPLIAGAVRPYRRATAGRDDAWNRAADVVLITLFGALASGSMYGAIPALTTFKPQHADRIGLVQWIVIGLLVMRWLMENAARMLVPLRLAEVENDGFDSPHRSQKVISVTARTLLFLFAMEVVIGNNWALWIGGLLFLYPNVVAEFVDSLPNLPSVYRYIPRNLTRTVAMMFVAMWWGSLVTGHLGDRPDAALWAFVVMGVPGQLIGVVDWFAREGDDWESTVLSKILGVGVLVLGFLMARGYLFS